MANKFEKIYLSLKNKNFRLSDKFYLQDVSWPVGCVQVWLRYLRFTVITNTVTVVSWLGQATVNIKIFLIPVNLPVGSANIVSKIWTQNMMFSF